MSDGLVEELRREAKSLNDLLNVAAARIETLERELGETRAQLAEAWGQVAALDSSGHLARTALTNEREYEDPGPDPQPVNKEWLEGITNERKSQ